MAANSSESARLVLISGSEDILRRRALAELKAFSDEEGGFDSEEFIAGEHPPSVWIASAMTAPFLTDRRTVIVRNILRVGDLDLIEPHAGDLASLPESARLILVADEEPGDDAKQQRFERLRKSLETFVKKLKGTILGGSVEAREVKTQLRKEVAAAGLVLSAQAFEELVDMTGGSLTRAVEELDKLKLFAGDGGSITHQDVRRLVIATREWRVYKMVDAALAGRPGEALNELKTLMGSSTKEADAAFSRIFPTMSRQIRMLWQARIILDAGGNASRIPDEIRPMLLSSADLSKEPDWKIPKIFALAKQTSLPRLAQCLAALADADARLKGGLDGFTPCDTLERMVVAMCSVPR
jgi:DNA polymerase-3 subunit delta